MSIKEIKELAKYCLKSKTPFLFVGHSGVGKTAVMRELANEVYPNHEFVTIMASQQEVGDFVGLPDFQTLEYIDENKRKKVSKVTSWARPEWMPTKPCVVFLDELNNARQDVESAMLQLVYENRIHTHRLHPDSVVVAAINPATDEYTTANTMSAALVKRFVVIPFEPEANETIKWGENTSKFDSEFIKFMKHDNEVIGVNKILDTAIKLEPCPRMWENVSRTKKLIEDENPNNKDHIIRNLLSYSMGTEIAAKFAGWHESQEAPVSYENIIENVKSSIKLFNKFKNENQNDLINETIENVHAGIDSLAVKLSNDIKWRDEIIKIDVHDNLKLNEEGIKEINRVFKEELTKEHKKELDSLITFIKELPNDLLYKFTRDLLLKDPLDSIKEDKDENEDIVMNTLNSRFFIYNYLYSDKIKNQGKVNLFNNIKEAAKDLDKKMEKIENE